MPNEIIWKYTYFDEGVRSKELQIDNGVSRV
jgi:hypothetical protein